MKDLRFLRVYVNVTYSKTEIKLLRNFTPFLFHVLMFTVNPKKEDLLRFRLTIHLYNKS